MRRFLTFFILFVVVSGAAFWLLRSKPDEDPKAAVLIKKNAYISTLRAAAEGGDTKAMVRLAGLYLKGDGVPKAAKAAMDWYKMAADQGNVQAAYEMAVLYARGLGVTQDYYAAAKWYRLAATFGKSADAQFALGQLYFTGRGVENDYAKALQYYEMAAAQGHAGAQYLLGAMYEEGWGLKVDLIRAYYWYTLAAGHAAEALAINPKYDPQTALKRVTAEMSHYQIGVGERMVRGAAFSRP